MNFAKLRAHLNGERPDQNRQNDDQITEKLLESIADASRHFHEQAMTEYNALPGHRKFEVAGVPRASETSLGAWITTIDFGAVQSGARF